MKIKVLTIILIIACFGCRSSSGYVRTELYFGLSNADGPISYEDWEVFKENHVNKILTGYTEVTAKGYWRNSEGEEFPENSIMLIYLHKKNEVNKLDSLINLYKTQFQQESVLQVDIPVRAYFK